MSFEHGMGRGPSRRRRGNGRHANATQVTHQAATATAMATSETTNPESDVQPASVVQALYEEASPAAAASSLR